MRVFSLVVFCTKRIRFILLTGLLVLVYCEIYMRFPLIPQRLEYDVDEEVVYVLKPSQAGYQWQGNMSYKSPLITINSEGHRGRETDWTKPVFVAFGNSEAFGSGVEDDEVWTAKLEQMFRGLANCGDLQVVNGAHPGDSPWKHYRKMVRLMEIHDVDGLIVRVDLADRMRNAITGKRLIKEVEKTRERQEIRLYTKGIPFLYNKIKAQEPSIRKVLGLRREHTGGENDPAGVEQADSMWKENRRWWEGMAREASERGIPLIFMLVDLRNASGYGRLEELLGEIMGEYEKVYTVRLMSRDFGLIQGPEKKVEQEIHETLTLKRDPHANALQHSLVGTRLYEHLMEQNVFPKVCEGRDERPRDNVL